MHSPSRAIMSKFFSIAAATAFLHKKKFKLALYWTLKQKKLCLDLAHAAASDGGGGSGSGDDCHEEISSKDGEQIYISLPFPEGGRLYIYI